MTPTRPPRIHPRDWQAMSWHQRQAAAARWRRTVADIEAERPDPRPVEPQIVGPHSRLLTAAPQLDRDARAAMRVLVGVLDQMLTEDYLTNRSGGWEHRHGHLSGYYRHLREGSTVCPDCRAAYRTDRRIEIERRRNRTTERNAA